jgi:phage shock protein PspC (stress-responsive transcriptional regulator)
MEKKLYRSRTDKKLCGVCGGIAEYFGIDTLLVRCVFVVFTLCGSVSFWIYLLLWLLAPKSK